MLTEEIIPTAAAFSMSCAYATRRQLAAQCVLHGRGSLASPWRAAYFWDAGVVCRHYCGACGCRLRHPAAMRRSSRVARGSRKFQRRVVHADTRPLALWHRGIAAWLFITRQANESPTASGFVALCHRGILKMVAAVFAPASAVELRNSLIIIECDDCPCPPRSTTSAARKELGPLRFGSRRTG